MTEAGKVISHEIERTGGPIPFSRFMELALYAPNTGYYEQQLTQIGRKGDFYTSVSVGPLFGALLAHQFAQWLRDLGTTSSLQVVECGAHNGQLAADILGALQARHADLLPRLRYRIIEPSPARRTAQQATLAPYGNVDWVSAISDASPVTGVVFSNELLDAMPVHLFAWDAGARIWRERGVDVEEGRFQFAPLSAPSIEPPQFPEELLDVLPNGYVVELSPDATNWWRAAAGALKQGRLMAIDYGGTFEELLNPGRQEGTIRAYSRHHFADVLASPGEQDLTAHVNFSEIKRTGERAGLVTETFTYQSQFLTAIARELWTAKGTWPPAEVRQFQTLTHPEHLGRPFRVLVQARKA